MNTDETKSYNSFDKRLLIALQSVGERMQTTTV